MLNLQNQDTNNKIVAPPGSDPGRSAVRAVLVLQHVAAADGPLTLTDLVRLTGIPASSAHGLLRDLASAGVIRVVPGPAYTVGPQLIALAVQTLSEIQAMSVAKRAMLALADRIGEDVYLALPGPSGMFYAAVETRSDEQGVHVTAPLGADRPVHATAIGQLYLALLPEEQRRQRLRSLELEPRTEHTITDLGELEERLAETRERGYARSVEENVEGIIAFSAAVRDHTGEFVAALSVSLIRERGLRREAELLPEMIQSARDASAELGWVEDSDVAGERERQGRE